MTNCPICKRSLRCDPVDVVQGNEVYLRIHYHVEPERQWSCCTIFWPDRPGSHGRSFVKGDHARDEEDRKRN